jgi:uridine kinase
MAEVYMSVSTWQQPVPPPASLARTELIDDLAGRICGLSPHRLRVAVDGLTAAGKTSFGHELAQQISRRGRPALRASLDDFKRPWRDRHLYDRETGEGYYRNAFDYAAAIELLLKPAGPDGSGDVALCSIDPLTQLDHSSVTTHTAPDSVLIVDGVFALRPEINPYWDFRIFLDVSMGTSLQRGAERDQNWSDSEAIHRSRYLPAERLYTEQATPLEAADVVIDNSSFSHPRILRSKN